MYEMKMLLLHISIAVYYFAVWVKVFHFMNDQRYLPSIEMALRCMSTWNLILQTMLFYGYLLGDILYAVHLLDDFRSSIVKLNLDFYFCSISAPLSMSISTVYWILWGYNKSLLGLPLGRMKVPPPLWLNHVAHTMIVVNAFLQKYFDELSSFNLSALQIPLISFIWCDMIFIYVSYYQKKFWIYGFFNVREPFRFLVGVLCTLWAITMSVIFNYAPTASIAEFEMNFLRIRYVTFFNSIFSILSGPIWFHFKKKELKQEVDAAEFGNIQLSLTSILYTAFTLWCAILQLVTFGLYLCHDILEFNGKCPNYRRKLKRSLDFLFYYIVAGNSLIVTGVFWMLYYGFGAELMYPTIPGINTLILPPIWLDHVFHTLVTVNVVLHAYENQTSPSSSVPVGLPITLFHTFYVICVYLGNWLTGLWMYPLFKVQEPYRLIMFLSLIFFSRYPAELVYHLNAYYCSFKSRKTDVDLKEN